MQMETTGLAETNLKDLWIDPYDYNKELREAVLLLSNRGITTYIYTMLNYAYFHPNCVHLPNNQSVNGKMFIFLFVMDVYSKVNVEVSSRQTTIT